MLKAVGNVPAGKVNSVGRGVKDGHCLALWGWANWIDQCANDANTRIRLSGTWLRPWAGMRDGGGCMSCCIVGVPGLRLKCEKDGNPLLRCGEVENQPTILPHTVIADKWLRIALVHVNVVDAIAGAEMKDLIGLLLWSPTLTKSIYERIGLIDGTHGIVLQPIRKIVIRTRYAWWQLVHVQSIEQVTADKIERGATWSGR